MLNVVSLYRGLRMLHFVAELEQVQIIIGTFEKFQRPFFIVCGSLYTVYYSYAVLGQLIFGAKITTKSAQIYSESIPPLYYTMNFNDFPSSFVTLFHIMIVNNWFITTDMCCIVMNSDWPRVFFASFWLCTVLIMLNLVISFVLEVYSEAEEKYAGINERRHFIHKLKK